MKINEIVNEGIFTRAWDAAKRYGVAGRGAQIQAWAKRHGEERAAAASVIDAQKRKAFIDQFKSSYAQGKSSGLINDSAAGSAMTSVQFIEQYAKAYASKITNVNNSIFTSGANKIAQEIVNANMSDDSIGKLFDYVAALKAASTQNKTSTEPDSDVTVTAKSGKKYYFLTSDGKWRLQSGAAPNTNPNSGPPDQIVTKLANIDALNKLAAAANI